MIEIDRKQVQQKHAELGSALTEIAAVESKLADVSSRVAGLPGSGDAKRDSAPPSRPPPRPTSSAAPGDGPEHAQRSQGGGEGSPEWASRGGGVGRGAADGAQPLAFNARQPQHASNTLPTSNTPPAAALSTATTASDLSSEVSAASTTKLATTSTTTSQDHRTNPLPPTAPTSTAHDHGTILTPPTSAPTSSISPRESLQLQSPPDRPPPMSPRELLHLLSRPPGDRPHPAPESFPVPEAAARPRSEGTSTRTPQVLKAHPISTPRSNPDPAAGDRKVKSSRSDAPSLPSWLPPYGVGSPRNGGNRPEAGEGGGGGGGGGDADSRGVVAPVGDGAGREVRWRHEAVPALNLKKLADVAACGDSALDTPRNIPEKQKPYPSPQASPDNHLQATKVRLPKASESAMARNRSASPRVLTLSTRRDIQVIWSSR